jgi:hypothetical protein
MSHDQREVKVCFHPGLAKTASTWLQHRFFPRLRGVHYLPRRQYRRYPEVLKRGEHHSYVVSREFDRQFAREVTRFAGHFPGAGTILLLRRHDGYLASQYCRYLKNGRFAEFSDFLDLDHDRGVWKQEEIRFMPLLRLLASSFRRPPLVLFHQDLLDHPHRVLGAMAGYIGAEYDPEDIDLGRVHASYGGTELKVMKAITRRLPRHPHPQTENRPFFHWLQVRSRLILVHAVLAAARLVPSALVAKAPLIPPEELRRVREFYADDWEACGKFAGESNRKALGEG